MMMMMVRKGRGGGVTAGISTEHFLYNENNLTNCSTQRNSPPIPHTPPPPPPPLHYHIKAASSEQVFSFKNGSEAERARGGREGEERTRPRQ